MSDRINISSGTSWETTVGYCRAVRIGNHIWVAGTTSVDEQGQVVGRGNVYEQAKYILGKIERALAEAGASMKDVVRTRMFITDMQKWQHAGAAHGEYFGAIRPAATMVEVVRLIDPFLLIEIEVDAYVS